MAESDRTSSAILILTEDQQNNVNRENERKNPLQNTLVLEEVFKNVSHKDLKTCRLVNKLWRSEATPIFKRKTRVCFYNDVTTDQLSSEKIARYLVEMRDFGNDSFHILENTVGNDFEGVYRMLVGGFFPYFGAQIKSLKLTFRFKELSDFENFRQIINLIPNVRDLALVLEVAGLWPIQVLYGIFDLTANVKQLEKVRKLDFMYHLDPNHDNVERDIDKLVSKFVAKLLPKLESLILWQEWQMDFSDILVEYANVAILEECKISEIEIHTWCENLDDEEFRDVHDLLLENNEKIDILYRWPTPLRKLHYYSSATEEFDAKRLENLLRKHAHSLEDIDISIKAYREFEEMQQIIMPTFPKLTRLNIENPSTSNSFKLNFIFHSTFEHHFPMLKVKNDKLVEMFAKLM